MSQSTVVVVVVSSCPPLPPPPREQEYMFVQDEQSDIMVTSAAAGWTVCGSSIWQSSRWDGQRSINVCLFISGVWPAAGE